MKTIIYLIRHSEKLNTELIDRYFDDEYYQITREKRILSSDGEMKAKKLSENKEFENLDTIYSSNYVRAIQTAKYFAEKQKIIINVDKGFNERKYGNPDKSTNIGLKQYYDENIKNIDGESRKEVTDRIYKSFKKVVDSNKGKRVAIFSHGAAITFLLMKWCELISIDEKKKKCLKFNDKIIIDKVFESPEVFKVILDENDCIENITNLYFKY